MNSEQKIRGLSPPKKIHLVGIGGIGMSGLAFILAETGCAVSGSDVVENPIIKKLRKKGITVNIGHSAGRLGSPDIVAHSSSIRQNNPELQAARESKIPVIPRIRLLKMVMDRYKRTVAISGTHGKTTITAMASLLAEEAGMDPTVLIGGESPHFGGNAKLGRKDTLIAEADESDGRFVILKPTHMIMPNLEWEHAEYYENESGLVSVFKRFIRAQSAKSTFFYRIEDSNLRALRRVKKGKAVSFGFSEQADVRAANIKINECKIEFDCFRRGKDAGPFTLNIPGIHNVINALGVISLGFELGIDTEIIKTAIASYRNARRRFEIIGDLKGVKVVEDYAHHPTEIRAVISAAHSTGPKRLITVFQPHRYTRTMSFRREFSNAFGGSDEVILTDVYSASEDKIEGADAKSIYNSMLENNSAPVKLMPQNKIPGYLFKKTKSGDLILILGAGDIWRTARKVLLKLKNEK